MAFLPISGSCEGMHGGSVISVAAAVVRVNGRVPITWAVELPATAIQLSSRPNRDARFCSVNEVETCQFKSVKSMVM